jgi:Zn-dependent M28 family amino/carboxypeptidase
VLACLRGTDPSLNDEFIVYTAHLDHIGDLHGDDHEDAINNGALDNAEGIAVMLDMPLLL